MGTKITQAQKEATRRYRAKNREKVSYQSSRSSARSFIKKANFEDLEEINIMTMEAIKNLCMEKHREYYSELKKCEVTKIWKDDNNVFCMRWSNGEWFHYKGTKHDNDVLIEWW